MPDIPKSLPQAIVAIEALLAEIRAEGLILRGSSRCLMLESGGEFLEAARTLIGHAEAKDE